MKKYDFKKIEAKWQKKWLQNKVFRADDKSKKSKFYQLETFPYPSAEGLHVGHPKGYIAEDIHARYMRMNGYNVLYTMGWDAFGLPTENYAIKVGKSPKVVAEANIKNFKRQVQMFGLSYDWDREINTSAPEYYKWTQWLFIELFKKGLAYRKKSLVNWCLTDMTVLANEQVIQKNDKNICERCGGEVVQKEMEQWFLKIAGYAERLLKDLNGLNWPEPTIKRQVDWIGKSEGAEISFLVISDKKQVGVVEVFTTRPDTIFGATYLVLAPEHPLVLSFLDQVSNKKEVQDYVEVTKNKKELDRIAEGKEKTGVELKGVRAVNPATQEEISIWIADYVLGSYGTGAIMAVPAHDGRDFEFAKKFNLSIKQVVARETGLKRENEEWRDGGCGIVFDPETQKYAVARWTNGHYGFFSGGTDKNEDNKIGVLREVTEESGLYDFKYVEKIGDAHAHFFNEAKRINRVTLTSCYLIILNSKKTQPLKLEDHEKFELVWVRPEEILADWIVSNKERSGDLEHWINFLKQGVGRTIELGYDISSDKKVFEQTAYIGEGTLVNSGKFDGLNSKEAIKKIVEFVKGKKQIQYRLRDWSVSRQRYWGVPIPLVFCENCAEQKGSKNFSKGEIENPGWVSVKEKDLPVKLPELKDYRPKGVAPLASAEKFWKVKCPRCGGQAKRETETLDTFVDSSWYYLRYTDPKNTKKPFDKLKVNHWLPVDLYIIGAEHTVLHLLYSRFITKFLYDEKYLKFKEPFRKLRHVGLIQGADGQKMSKSRGNVVNPDDLVNRVGADSVRLYEMFMGPFEQGQPWDTQGVLGTERFLARVWKILEGSIDKNSKVKVDDKFEVLLHRTIKKVGEDIQNLSFNTAISSLMILLNEMERQSRVADDTKQIFVKMLYPFAPHLTEEIWHEIFKKKNYLQTEKWPKYNPKLIKSKNFVLVVQVNGKIRDSFEVEVGITEKQARELVLSREKIKMAIDGKSIKKLIFIPDKLINLVI